MKNKSKYWTFLTALITVLLMLIYSCNKENLKEIKLPTVTTDLVTDISSTSAICKGNDLSDGGANEWELNWGICFSNINMVPTVLGDFQHIVPAASGLGSFSAHIEHLTPGTKYYVRAFAHNQAGFGYGEVVSFSTTGSVKGDIIFNPNLTYDFVNDIVGNIYRTIKIDNQTWMAENLKTTKYNNGDLIGTTSPANLNIGAESLPKYQWVYDANENNVTTYGRLYTWFAATDNRNVCPKGWHVPTDVEWSALNSFLGGEGASGGKLKETGLNHWITPNSDANNSSGFAAIPGGWRYYDGASEYLGYFSYWWSSTEGNVDNAWWRQVNYVNPNFSRNTMNKKYGLSVRCIKDN